MECVDGSFPDFFRGRNSDLLTGEGQNVRDEADGEPQEAPGSGTGRRSVVFDYTDDPELLRQGTRVANAGAGVAEAYDGAGSGAAGRLAMLNLASYEDILERVNIGFRWEAPLRTAWDDSVPLSSPMCSALQPL